MLELRQSVRVEWGQCDPARILFNPHYYIWMDQGTHHLLSVAGFDYLGALTGNSGFRGCPLVSSGAEFKSPARFWDVLELRSRISRFGGKSFTVSHDFRIGERVTAVGQEVRVWGWSDADDPDRLVAVPVPEDVKLLLSVDAVRTLPPAPQIPAWSTP